MGPVTSLLAPGLSLSLGHPLLGRACLVYTAGTLLCLLGLRDLSPPEGHRTPGQESQELGQELLCAMSPWGHLLHPQGTE